MIYHGCETAPCDLRYTQERCFEFDVSDFLTNYENDLADCGS